MKHTQGARKASVRQKVIVAAVASACATGALAFGFDTESGWTGSLNTTVSGSGAWRVQGRDKELMAAENAIATREYDPLSDQTAVQAATLAGTIAAINGAYGTAGPTAIFALTGGGAAAQTAVRNAVSPVLTGTQFNNLAKNAGYAAGGKNVAGQWNYDDGDMYNATLKFITDLNLKKGGTAALVRVKGWYDYAQNEMDVPYGAINTGTGLSGGLGLTPGKWNKPLSDKSAHALSRFEGVYLLDAYIAQDVDVGDFPAQVRVGRQAINWGESIFLQGINQTSPIDVTAARRAGAEIKEAFLPIWAISGSIGLPGGTSLEGFYQLKWEPTVLESCGTYWGGNSNVQSHVGACNVYSPAVPGTSGMFPIASNLTMAQVIPTAGFAALGGNAAAAAAGSYISEAYRLAGTPATLYTENNKGPKDSGQWGVAFRFPVDAIDGEMGIYAQNIHARAPVLAGNLRDSNAGFDTVAALIPDTVLGAGNAAVGAATEAVLKSRFGGLGTYGALRSTIKIEYPEDIKLYGLTASFNVSGVSIGAELSYQQDVPVTRNTGDLNALAGIATGASSVLVPQFPALQARLNAGAAKIDYDWYERFNKFQFQLNGIASLDTLPKMLGAISGNFIGEIGIESNDVPDYKKPGALRYGRPDSFGAASFSTTNAAIGAAGLVASPTQWSLANGVYTFNACNNAAASLGVTAPTNPRKGCKNDGFVTDFSWGYRMRLALDYSDFLGSGFVFTPSVFWSHDVEGVAMNGMFQEGSTVLNLGLNFNLNKTHNINVGYTQYDGKFNVNRDRDSVGATYSYSF